MGKTWETRVENACCESNSVFVACMFDVLFLVWLIYLMFLGIPSCLFSSSTWKSLSLAKYIYQCKQNRLQWRTKSTQKQEPILVGGFKPFFFSHSVGNFIIPTDELTFFRGVGIPPTRQGRTCRFLLISQ